MPPRRRDNDRYKRHPERRPRLPADGIKAKSQRGDFGESWWAKRWISVLEGFGYGGRLARGRTYARGGAVLSIEIGRGQVSAKVQGSLPRPYQVKISLAPLSDAQWASATGAMAEQAIFAAKLLAGEMPQEIEQAFAAAKVPLFPRNSRDLTTTCSCPDQANPCKHIAAVYYLLGERFDEDPFLLFELRGRNKDQIGAALRGRRADTSADAVYAAAPRERAPALADLLVGFDEPATPLERIAPHVAAPEVEAGLLRRYGAPPAGVEDGLRAAYTTLTRAALERLLGGE